MEASRQRLRIYLIAGFFSVATLSFAQTDNLSLYDLDIVDLSRLQVISATKTEQQLGEVLSTVRIISRDEIVSRGYFTLDEVLSDLPGFQFRNPQSLNSYVFQRGIPNQNNLTLVLIDGVQINELNSGGFYGGGQYNLSNVERIEIVYGPSSVEYGTNAVSGVINIITSETDQNKGHIRGLSGNRETFLADALLGWKNDELRRSIKLSGMVKKSGMANLKGAEGDFNWTDLLENEENDYSLGLRANYNDFILSVNYLNKQTSTISLQPSVGTSYRDYGTLWNIFFLNNSLRYKKEFSKSLRFSSLLYYRNTTVQHNTVYYVLDTAQVGYFRPNSMVGFENVLNYKVGRSVKVTGGLVFEFEKLANNPSWSYSQSAEIKPPKPPKPPMHSNFLVSVFVEPTVKLFDALLLAGGIRFDQSTVYDRVLTPKLGARYNIGNQSIRINYSEAFRAPKPWDYTDGVGNSDLKPEKMRAFELSYNLHVNHQFNAELNVFRNKLNNGFFRKSVEEGHRWINKDEITTRGLELGVNYKGRNVNASFNYTLTESKDSLGIAVPEISKHIANASISTALSTSFNANIRLNYVGVRDNPTVIKTTGEKKVDDFLLVNASLGWNPTKPLLIQFIVRNIFDVEYYHTSNRLVSRYRQPQRTCMVSMVYNFNLDK